MHISFFLCCLKENSYFTELLIYHNSVLFKYTQIYALSLITENLFILQKFECIFVGAGGLCE